jgi:hypothetical protein
MTEAMDVTRNSVRYASTPRTHKAHPFEATESIESFWSCMQEYESKCDTEKDLHERGTQYYEPAIGEVFPSPADNLGPKPRYTC